MEAPKEELEVFSPILLHEYIRLMTAVKFIKSEGAKKTASFKISAANYAQMMAEPLQTALIGLTLEYDAAAETLKATPDDDFIAQFDNKIMHDVALMYAENYGQRYAKFITAES